MFTQKHHKLMHQSLPGQIGHGWPPAFRKIIQIMKLAAFIMTAACLQLSARAYPQKRLITLDMHRVSLEKVFTAVKKQSSYYFLYRNENLPQLGHSISLRVKDATIEEVMDRCLKGLPLAYRIMDNTVIITRKPQVGGPPALSAVQPQEPVSGTVKDSTGKPLIGVTIKVRGGEGGAVTDGEGHFKITVASDAVLVISYIGYQAVEVPVNGRKSLQVTLHANSNKLDQLVVIGYGTQRKSDLTGSITSVSADQFNQGAALSPQELIQGKAAGVNIIPASGKPGSSMSIRIRGGTSITAGNEPLYVVDGVPLQLSSAGRQSDIGGSNGQLMLFNQEPVNPLNSINPADIASIEILKDASATAIYGSRGANGVVIITTKRGKAGGLSTTYDASFGVSKVAGTLDVLSADEYRQFMKDHQIANFIDQGGNTNWQDQIYRTALSQNHNLSLSGGTPQTQYRASVGFLSQQGVILSSGMHNYTGRVSITHKALSDKLTFDLNMSGAQISEDNAAISGELSGEGGNLLKDALRFNPTLPVYTDGKFTQINQFQINPVSYTEIKDQRTTRRNLLNLSTTYQIIEALKANVNLGYAYENIERNANIPRSNPLGEGLGGLVNSQNSEHWNQLLETTLSYDKAIGKHQHINVVAGYSYQLFVDQGKRERVQGFISDAFGWDNLAAASQINTLSSYKETNKLISFYGRVNYNLLERYLVTVTVRRDGSSRFGANNKWGVFPSGALAWKLSNESFYPSAAVVNDLKVRASYGITGNQDIGNLLSLPTLGATSNSYVIGSDAITVVTPEQYANPDLKWEQTAQLDVGIDFQLLKGRIYGSADYYKKKTRDLLLRFQVPSPSVVATQVANVGSVENAGVEFTVGSHILQRGRFQWQADLNISSNRNKVTSLSNDIYSADIIYGGLVSGYGLSGVNSQAIMPGQPIGTFYGPESEGVKDGKEQFRDVNGDGDVSTTNDLAVIGHALPKYIFGLTNSFTYGKFSLAFILRGSQGNDVLNNTALDLQNLSLLPGQNVLAPALHSGIAYGQPAIYSSRWIENGSFIRLDNVTLAYQFDVSQTSFLRNARVYVTGQNLLLITGYSGLDPEVNSNTNGSGTSPRGIDYMAYPRAKTITVGASVTF